MYVHVNLGEHVRVTFRCENNGCAIFFWLKLNIKMHLPVLLSVLYSCMTLHLTTPFPTLPGPGLMLK